MTDAPRYATLRDYLRVVRTNRWIILICVIVFGGGAVLLAKSRDSIYQAQTQLNFRDVETQTSNLIGISVAPTQDTTQRIQSEADTITRPDIVKLVAKRLGGSQGSRSLTSGVSAAVGATNTDNLIIQAQATDPEYAATLANAYADAVQIWETRQASRDFTNAARKLQVLARQPSIAGNPAVKAQYSDRVVRLKFAAATAQPVQIATTAVRPSTPVSPHPVRDGILGVILGLTIGVIIAFVRDALDRRPRGAPEITDELGFPILGHISEGALGRAGFITVAGRERLDDAELEGFRILRQNVRFLDVDDPPKTLVIASAMPEEGKSTVAASLACANALTGKLTLLVDCDLRRPSIGSMFGVDSEPGLTDYLIGEAKPDEILRQVPLVEPRSTNGLTAKSPDRVGTPPQLAGASLVVIPAGRRTKYPSELMTSQRMQKFLEGVSDAYEMVIIDSGPVLAVSDTLHLLPEAQGALLCVRASKTTREQIRALREAIDRLPQRPIGVVVTGVRSGSESDFGYYSYKYPYS